MGFRRARCIPRPVGRLSGQWYVGNMRRRKALLILTSGALAAACGTKPAAKAPELPASVGGLSRTALHPGDPSAAPEPARALKPVAWTHAVYESGGTRIEVQALLMSVEAVAFELQQKWPRGNGVTSFYRGPNFAACSSNQVEMKLLVEFASQLEATWLGGSGR
jgi:hypothetical protein